MVFSEETSEMTDFRSVHGCSLTVRLNEIIDGRAVLGTHSL